MHFESPAWLFLLTLPPLLTLLFWAGTSSPDGAC
jgi:hypothetical protein